MLLFPKLAGKIVNEVQMVIKEDIIVVDTKGLIIASTQQNRVGTLHKGAQLVLHTKKKLYIDEFLEKQLEGVRMGINLPILIDGRIIGVIGITGNPVEVEHYADLIRRLTELIIQETVHAEQVESKTRGLESYFYEWVNVKSVDQQFIDRGLMLGIQMQEPHLCCFIQLKNMKQKNEDGQFIEREIFEWFQNYFQMDDVVRFGPGRFLLLKSVDRHYSDGYFRSQLGEVKKYVEMKYHTSLSIGVGKTVGTYLIAQSYKEAQKAMKVAGKSESIVFYEELLLDIMIEEVPIELRKEYLEKTIGKVKNNQELMDTLKIYLANNQSVKGTAAEMHIHINTLHYRLKQMKELTEIDPKKTEGIALFYLALKLMDRL
ncbi:carbohydrate diacid regulator [Bacillus pakistanensis]|uniref:Carbohydrate diacid regulator n=1 Tax=Rossellomorea pakistanensis TaxID=992288 RepID=A0ABS2NH27_9BACI|nr:sugar diacid recognition domain-containing protein [Bacillus pakistanensis]MBM7587154.1 carbohydrate diacid regulator [Bacillus pakistanensis]